MRIPAEQRLGKCETCKDLKDQIREERDPIQREAYKADMREHITAVKAERAVYHGWRTLCREQPDKYLCVILDGMDQCKANVGA